MVIDYDQLGHITTRRGNRSTWTVPRNAYRTKDEKWVAVSSAANSIAPRLFRAIGWADFAEDPIMNHKGHEGHKGIHYWVLELPLKQDFSDLVCREVLFVNALLRVLCVLRGKWSFTNKKGRHKPAFPWCGACVYDVAQIFTDPQVEHRGTLTESDDPVLGKVRIQNVVPKFKRNPGRIRWLGKAEIGADTEAVLDELGYGAEDISRLASAGVIKTAS